MSPSVFISYSSNDRELVLAIEKRLREHGVNTWLDRHQLAGGATWTTELVKAIRSSDVVLLMASANAFASANVQKEIALAGEGGKTIIPLILEPALAIPASFEYWLVEKHRLEAFESDAKWLPRLLDALTRFAGVDLSDDASGYSTPYGGHAIGGRTQQPTRFVQNLADRATQERQIFAALEDHMAHKSQRPLVLIVHGDRSQSLDGFLVRLEKYTLPQHLKRLRLTDQLDWQHVQWPPAGSNRPDESGAVRAEAYRVDVNLALGLGASSDSQSLAKNIENLRRPVAFCSLIDSPDWQVRELPLLRNIVKFWADFPNTNRSQVVIICLAIVLDSTRKHLLSRWLRREQQKQTVIETLHSVISANDDIGLILLPELADVQQGDLEHWVRHYLKPDDLEDALRKLRHELKAIGVAPQDSLPMDRLIPVLRRMMPPQTPINGV